MDKTLNLKLGEFKKALDTLKEAIDMFDQKNILVRDATIKRFEYSFELCWKTSKVFLREEKGDLTISPKDCFKTLSKYSLSSEEVEELLTMVDDRNETTHAYGEKFIRELYPKIKNYFKLMLKVYQLIQK